MANVVTSHLGAENQQLYTSLQVTLNDLLTQYLALLDQHQKLRRELSQDIASGHFNLARANFSNPHRTRYGRDFYDERMQASRRVSCDTQQSFTLIDFPLIDAKASAEQSQPRREVNAEQLAALDSERKVEDHEAETPKTEPDVKDPLVWFGMLAPSMLKLSQSAFKVAVGKTVRLATVDKQMKAMEIEIRRTRKKMNIAAK